MSDISVAVDLNTLLDLRSTKPLVSLRTRTFGNSNLTQSSAISSASTFLRAKPPDQSPLQYHDYGGYSIDADTRKDRC